MVFNVRQKQTDVLVRALNLNSAATPGKEPSDLYKVLILDRFTKDVVAPLLRLNDLRKHGITLHLMLEAERQAIPDVPAVYFVQPTQANMERIASDATAALYESMHLNFTTSLPSKQLEALALAVVKGEKGAQRIAKLHDQYLAFIALEPTLFSLGLTDAYVQLNDPSAQDSQIEAVVASIVDGLFSVCVTLGVVPIIRCPRGGVAEHVAAQLDQKLRDALRARNNLFVEGVLGLSASLTRPLLCLFDRNFDMSSALQHSWTYKPMVQDVLGMHLNRIILSAEAGPGPGSTGPGLAGGKRTYDVDEHDFFWEACGTHAFPRVAEEVETQLQRYRTAVEEINKRTAAGAQEGEFVDADELLRKNTQNLMAAVSSLPELQEQKKTLDKHTNLATALLAAIKGRGLDAWHTTDEEVLCGKADLGAVLRLLGGARGSPADRLRLALLWLLTSEGVPSEADYNELEGAVRAGGADPTALAYVRTLRRNNLVGARPGCEGGAGGGGPAQGGAALLDYVAKSVKTLLAGSRQAPLTVAVEALMEGRQGATEHESFAVFDPKAAAGRSGPERAKGPFREALVFMIGGGNYAERETLAAWAARGGNSTSASSNVLSGVGGGGMGAPRHILYGATELLSGEQFVAQLAELGRRSGLGQGGLSLAGHSSTSAGGSKLPHK